MITITITPEMAMGFTVRGDVAGVLEGFEGMPQRRCPACMAHRNREDCYVCACGGSREDVDILPLSSLAVCDHLVRVLLRGVRCGDCPGDGRCPTGEPHACHECDGTGYLRPPADLRPFLHYEGDDASPPRWITAALIAVTFARLEAGMSPIDVVAGPWTPYRRSKYNDEWWGVERRPVYGGRTAHGGPYILGNSAISVAQGGTLAGRPVSGRSTPESEDATALSGGVAILDAGPVLRVNVPDEWAP